ncbi:hypothetical protein E2C01_078912 [Portunus trituberculatus]|uniref:Uncharacterized protein n=1 Tax=Portunus trituberculatus TaxID=210409 RepID=A0A5B7IVE7_PORTR|nr:hypothetical protein [Portunus trituberculatus]
MSAGGGTSTCTAAHQLMFVCMAVSAAGAWASGTPSNTDNRRCGYATAHAHLDYVEQSFLT